MTWALAIVALALLGVAAVSRWLTGTPVTPAMVFVAVGLLVGPEVLDGIDVESSSATVRALAEATLAFVLFCDASRIDLGRLRLAPGGDEAACDDQRGARHGVERDPLLEHDPAQRRCPQEGAIFGDGEIARLAARIGPGED